MKSSLLWKYDVSWIIILSNSYGLKSHFDILSVTWRVCIVCTYVHMCVLISLRTINLLKLQFLLDVHFDKY